MKIAMLAPANSIHTQRWLVALSRRGHDITLFTQHPILTDTLPDSVRIERLPFSGRIGYFLNAALLAWRLRRLRPDLLHTHYASGYGTTAALTGFYPSLLSVWGSDVFTFPKLSRLNRALVSWNLRRATRIASTSNEMAAETLLLARGRREPYVTPFGVDCRVFYPCNNRDVDTLTIGTVKTLARPYGIDVLIQAFALLRSNLRNRDAGLASRLRLLIVGDGPQRAELVELIERLELVDTVTLAGAVPHSEVPFWLNKLHIYVAASRQESFGVAVVEASACGIPVVVTDVGGLPEVVRDDVTGLIVPHENPGALADALSQLVLDCDLRQRLGLSGRAFVLKHFEWERCVDIMETLYFDIADSVTHSDRRTTQPG